MEYDIEPENIIIRAPYTSDNELDSSLEDGIIDEKYIKEITASKLNFVPVDSTNVVASINASTEGISIVGGRISISADSSFASGYDPTTKAPSATIISTINASSEGIAISGAKISITALSTFASGYDPTTKVPTAQVVATINASVEGITIAADKIAISGATTFTAGYDPTTKVTALGGNYASAASGARVLIFPDSSTGIQIIDDATATVFKVLVGGADVGDVVIGNYAGGYGMLWDKSAGRLYIKGDLTAGNIDAARVTTGTFSTSRIPNLSADIITSGDIGTNRLSANVLAALKASITYLSAIVADIGTINAGTISGVTITGGVLQTATSGARVKITGADNSVRFYNGGGNLCGEIYGDSGASGSLVIDGAYSLYIDVTAVYTDWIRPMDSTTLTVCNIGDTLDNQGNLLVGGWVAVGGDVDMNGHKLFDVSHLDMNTGSKGQFDENGSFYYYEDDGDYFFGSNNNGWEGRFSQISQ